MPIRKKINLKIYSLLSIVHLALTYFLVLNTEEYKVILVVFLATIINQWMLVDTVESLVQSAAGDEKVDTGNAILMFLGKTLILIIALSFGVHIMGKRIIIPVLNYVVQIFILYFSFRRKDYVK